MKRTIRIVNIDGSHKDLPIKGFSTLPSELRGSLSINAAKDGQYFLCVSESLIPDFTRVEKLEVIRA